MKGFADNHLQDATVRSSFVNNTAKEFQGSFDLLLSLGVCCMPVKESSSPA